MCLLLSRYKIDVSGCCHAAFLRDLVQCLGLVLAAQEPSNIAWASPTPLKAFAVLLSVFDDRLVIVVAAGVIGEVVVVIIEGIVIVVLVVVIKAVA